MAPLLASAPERATWERLHASAGLRKEPSHNVLEENCGQKSDSVSMVLFTQHCLQVTSACLPDPRQGLHAGDVMNYQQQCFSSDYLSSSSPFPRP